MQFKQHLKVLTVGVILFCTTVSCNNKEENTDQALKSDVQQIKEEPGAGTVNEPQRVRPESAGVLRLTAENGKAEGPDIKYMPEWRAFGWFTAKDKVEWEVEVQEAGEYQTTLEWSVSDEEAGKEFLLETKNQKLTGKVAPSGSWETFKTEPIGTVKLEAGIQNITFKSNQHFDKGAILDLREIKLTLVK